MFSRKSLSFPKELTFDCVVFKTTTNTAETNRILFGQNIFIYGLKTGLYTGGVFRILSSIYDMMRFLVKIVFAVNYFCE